MAYDKKGKAPKVKDRWYGDHKYRHGRELKPVSSRVHRSSPSTSFTSHRSPTVGTTARTDW